MLVFVPFLPGFGASDGVQQFLDVADMLVVVVGRRGIHYRRAFAMGRMVFAGGGGPEWATLVDGFEFFCYGCAVPAIPSWS